MKAIFDKMLLALAVLAAALAFCGAERADGSLDLLWFTCWLLAAFACGGISTLIERRQKDV